MRILGIDPSQRHFGLCLLEGQAQPKFHEIQTGGLDVLSSVQHIRRELQNFLTANEGEDLIFAMEKQLSIGASMSSLQFYVQMTTFEVIQSVSLAGDPVLILPLPIQLTSYMKKMHQVVTSSDTQIVRCFKEATGYKGRVSIHCVDAYYVALMARDVLAGKWSYPLSTKESPLTPWRIENGELRISDRPD